MSKTNTASQRLADAIEKENIEVTEFKQAALARKKASEDVIEACKRAIELFESQVCGYDDVDQEDHLMNDKIDSYIMSNHN